MSKISRKQKNKALTRFFMALLLVISIALVLYLLLLIGDDGERSYIQTGEIENFVAPTRAPIISATEVPSTKEPQFKATSEPTATPTPMPTPEATVEPTVIPEEIMSKKADEFKLPDITKDGSAGISRSYASIPDEYTVLVLEGWCYVDSPDFDGSDSAAFLIIRNRDTGKSRAYSTQRIEGIAGVEHPDAECSNAVAADWQAVIDVSDFDSGEYSLSIVIAYKDQQTGKRAFRRYGFSELQGMTIKNGEIITPPLASSTDDAPIE